ncbi:MAG UNVERIFIED_CONTAM: hypothetical protein LVR18_40925 [Planctomycetaceae bacterium]|jgi:hypothetical protein
MLRSLFVSACILSLTMFPVARCQAADPDSSAGTAGSSLAGNSDPVNPETVLAAMVRAVQAFRKQAGFRGGYVYEVSLDGSSRRGEGDATATEIWVQPPGTPEVAGAFLDAYRASPRPEFLEAANAAAAALLHGQLESGGWADRVDFDPAGKNAGRYRDGRGKAKGRNYSTLDDDKTQSALRFSFDSTSSCRGQTPNFMKPSSTPCSDCSPHNSPTVAFRRAGKSQLPQSQ